MAELRSSPSCFGWGREGSSGRVSGAAGTVLRRRDKSVPPVEPQTIDMACVSACRSVVARAAFRLFFNEFNEVFGTVAISGLCCLPLRGPDQRHPLKAGPLRGGACRASLDRLSPARQGLGKQLRRVTSASAPFPTRTSDRVLGTAWVPGLLFVPRSGTLIHNGAAE